MIGGGTGGGGGGPTLLLDAIGTSAARAYSTRKLRSAYAGSAIRIRRSSDNAEQDIGFSGQDLDTSSISSFVGANSAFLSKWYDQSGNADDLVQVTTSKQPRIVDTGTIETKNSLAVVRGISANFTILIGASSANLAEGTILAALNFSSPFPDYIGLMTGTNVGAIGVIGNSGGTGYYTSGIFGSTIAVNGGGNTAVFGGTLQQIDGHGTATSMTAPQLFKDRNDPVRYLDGWIGESVFFATALSSGDRTTMRTNQKTYWGTP